MHQALNFFRKGALRRTDEEIQRITDRQYMINAICEMPGTPLKLAEKLRRGQPLGAQLLRLLPDVARRAVFSIPTDRHDFFLAPSLRLHGGGAIGLSATAVPHAKEADGNIYLCMHEAVDKARLKATFVISHLLAAGSERTVVATSHALDRLKERTCVRGSFVAYLSQSIELNRTIRQTPRGPLLEVIDHDRRVIAYCPLDSCRALLNDPANTLPNGASFLEEQDRWVLKTVLTPEMVVP